MKVIMAFLFISMLLWGCSRHPAEPQSQIVGTWIANDSQGKIIYSSDGHFSSDWHYHISHSNIYQGTWQIVGNVLTLTVTNTLGTGPHEAVGNADNFEITRLDDNELDFRDLLETNMLRGFTREK